MTTDNSQQEPQEFTLKMGNTEENFAILQSNCPDNWFIESENTRTAIISFPTAKARDEARSHLQSSSTFLV